MVNRVEEFYWPTTTVNSISMSTYFKYIEIKKGLCSFNI